MRRSIRVIPGPRTLITDNGSAGRREPCWKECSATGSFANDAQMIRRAIGWKTCSPQRSASRTRSSGYSGGSGTRRSSSAMIAREPSTRSPSSNRMPGTVRPPKISRWPTACVGGVHSKTL